MVAAKQIQLMRNKTVSSSQMAKPLKILWKPEFVNAIALAPAAQAQASIGLVLCLQDIRNIQAMEEALVQTKHSNSVAAAFTMYPASKAIIKEVDAKIKAAKRAETHGKEFGEILDSWRKLSIDSDLFQWQHLVTQLGTFMKNNALHMFILLTHVSDWSTLFSNTLAMLGGRWIGMGFDKMDDPTCWQTKQGDFDLMLDVSERFSAILDEESSPELPSGDDDVAVGLFTSDVLAHFHDVAKIPKFLNQNDAKEFQTKDKALEAMSFINDRLALPDKYFSQFGAQDPEVRRCIVCIRDGVAAQAVLKTVEESCGAALLSMRLKFQKLGESAGGPIFDGPMATDTSAFDGVEFSQDEKKACFDLCKVTKDRVLHAQCTFIVDYCELGKALRKVLSVFAAKREREKAQLDDATLKDLKNMNQQEHQDIN